MVKEFWNKRYGENESVYGTQPNLFFKNFIDSHTPGNILLPAEGEGRNAVYAAKKGWTVDAFDYSDVAKNKALQLAEDAGVSIHYEVMMIENFEALKLYDAVALIYVHLDEEVRKIFFEKLIQSLKPGGFLVMEVFTKKQLQHNSGGPKDENYLYDKSSIQDVFNMLEFELCEEMQIDLDEGDFHKGKADVLHLVARKKNAG